MSCSRSPARPNGTAAAGNGATTSNSNKDGGLSSTSSTNSSASSATPSVPASPTKVHSHLSVSRPAPKLPVVTLGVCAMDVKARSKAMREILTRLVEIENGGVEVKIFGDVVILEEGEFTFSTKAGVP